MTARDRDNGAVGIDAGAGDDAFVAPGKTPAPTLDRWNEELVKALKAPEVADELTRAGLLPAPGTRDELARTIAEESRTWGKVIADRKITVE